MSQPTRVEFFSRSGVTLRGDFFKAAQPNAPIVVMLSGFSLLKEMTHGAALKFQAAGISALTYDNQSFGSSDGTPRHEVNLYRQAEDFHDAVTAARSLPGVNPDQVIMWGIGHGGTTAMMAAGRDPRVSAVILHAPFPSGEFDAANIPAGQLERAWQERETLGKNPETTRQYAKTFRDWENDSDGDDSQVFIKGIAAHYLMQGNIAVGDAAGTPWENRVTLQSFINVANTQAFPYFEQITQPLLYMVNDNDPFNVQPRIHEELLGELKSNITYQVIAQPSAGDLGQQLDSGFTAQVEWLQKILGR